MRAELRDTRSSGVLVPRPRAARDDATAADRPDRHRTTGADEFGEPFVGRTEELALLLSATEQARCGHPNVVRVDGPAGIGKTMLVEQFLQGQSDLQVLRCAGEREEATVAFGVTDQLFLAAGSPSARLLVGRDHGPPCLEPTTVGGRILTFLEEREEKGPVVLVVDDLQWADPESMRALLFALRRVGVERVLTLLVTRDDVSEPVEGLFRLAAGHAGTVLHLPPLTVREVHALVSSMTTGPVPPGLMVRLHTHTLGNPAYLREVLADLPPDRWNSWQRSLPVPRTVGRSVRHLVGVCPPGPLRLVEAAAVLGDGARLRTVAALAGVEDALGTLEVANAVGLLDVRNEQDGREVVFPHPLVRAAVYEQLGPMRWARLHLAAAELVDGEGARLRHRVAAADPPDEGLAVELAGFAQRQAGLGAWSGVASALVDAARMSEPGPRRDARWLRALDVLVGTGALGDADALAVNVVSAAPGALRDAVLGHRAILDARRNEAETLLAGAWERCDRVRDPATSALVAERCALHSLGRLRPDAVVEWARRAVALAPADNGLTGTADALLRIGLAWSGRIREPAAAGSGSCGADGPAPDRPARPTPADDLAVAMAGTSDALDPALRNGWVAHRVWAFVWSSRVEFVAGAWDEAVVAASRAVALVEESGHEWLRPLARWAAVGVPAARGEWGVAQEHARSAVASGGDYELMVVAGGLAGAQVAAARGDHERVLRALEPVAGLESRAGVDEPGFWLWQGLYGDALVSAGRLEEAEAFLGPHEELAAVRGRRLGVAMLARVRGRLESAAGRAGAAEEAFERGLAQLVGLSVPFPRALVELGFGQVLRRHGYRRAAVERLESAREDFAGLRARPYVEWCERELGASGLAPAKRRDVDPGRLTAQESAVAQLVARGLSNRRVASELFVSVKTVQFHLTRIYSKLGIKSRVELAANYHGTGTT